jgi:hypothetical protein
MSKYRVIDYYDLRPVDWLSGKRLPLEPGTGHVCDRCGAEHAVVYVVEDTESGRTYRVGSGCATQSFGFDPEKNDEAKRLIKTAKEETAKRINAARLEAVDTLAKEIFKAIQTTARPPVVFQGDAPFKYAHFPGQLVRTFTMGDVESTELQPSSGGGWHDGQTVDLLLHRWISARIEESIPEEWQKIDVSPYPDRPRKNVTSMALECGNRVRRMLR